MEDSKITRFKDASWLGHNEECIVGGAGGISSWLAFLLARANFKPVVYDFDTLEPHNIGGQLYPISGIYKPKVVVLSEVIKQFSEVDIWAMNEKYTSESMTDRFVFSGFDNMEARKTMFTLWSDYVANTAALKSECIFIDGRLLAEQLQIFCITGDNQESISRYFSEFLFSDEEVPDAPCTMKQTSHAAAMIASFMVGYFTNHIHNIRTNSKSRHIPFMREYYIPLDLMQ